MSTLLKKLVFNPEKRRLLENFLSLSVLQAANYLLPLITFPYLVRVLGPDRWGLISFAQAFNYYFTVITDYGFNLSATREISLNRNDKVKISQIFSAVIIIKFTFLIISFLVMLLLVFNIEKFESEWMVYLFTFGMVVGQALFPVWFFQGMEKMGYITMLNILSKSLYVVTIFIVVHETADYIYVPILNALGWIIGGILAQGIVIKRFNTSFKFPGISEIKYHLKEGWHIFISTVAISLYTASSIVILGLFASNTIVGYYASAEKIIKAFQGLFDPMSQTLYPHVSKMVNESRERGIRFLRKVTGVIGATGIALSLLIFIFADVLVEIVLGRQYFHSIVLLRMLAILPFIISLSSVFSIQTMLTFNYKKALSRILLSAGGLNIALALLLVPIYQQFGTCLAVVITELYILIFLYFYLQTKGIRLITLTRS